MTPFHLPSIRSSVASTAQPGLWAKLRRFMRNFPIVSKWGLVPQFYSTCKMDASATGMRHSTGGSHESRRIPEIAARRGVGFPHRFRNRKARTEGARHQSGGEGDLG